MDLGDILVSTYGWVTDETWVGKLNFAERRIFGERSEELKKLMAYIETEQQDDKIVKLYDEWKNEPKIQWKDSIKKVINK